MDNSKEKDNARDIAPSFHKMMGRGATGGGGGGDNGDDGYGSDGDDDDEFAVTWTLRKAAATALDAISVSFGGHEVLRHFLGPLKQLLSVPVPADPAQDTTDAWLRVESGILALGCIADGCPQIVGYLDELFPMLLNWASHARPLIRKIALWCMSRYSEWLLRVSLQGLGRDAALHGACCPVLLCAHVRPYEDRAGFCGLGHGSAGAGGQ